MKSTAVARAASEADALHEEVYGTTTIEDAPDVTPEENGVPEVPATAGDDSESPTAETETFEPVGETPPTDDTTEDKWEVKYKTLQGMFNAQMPELQAKVRELGEKNQSLESIIGTMESAPAEPATPATSSLTAEEIADYGPDMTDFVKRAAQDAIAPQLDGLRAENEKLIAQNLQLQASVGNVEATHGADAKHSMFTALASEVPDWSEINQSQEFLGWLKETDAFSGQIRHDLLLTAFEANDSSRVSIFFNAFKRDKQLVTPTPQPPAALQPTVPLSSLVAPGKGSASTTQPPTDEDQSKIWDTSEISAFYRDVQRGKFAGREAEKARLENAIVKAGREGRVR
jgi:hypothetical protein